MSSTQQAPNFDQSNVKATGLLALPVNAGDSTCTLQNVDNFTSGDIVYVWNVDTGTTERAVIASIAGQVFTMASPFVYSHIANESVVDVYGDQIDFYSVAVPIDGSLPPDTSFVSAQIVNIMLNSLTTNYVDPTGGSQVWYKFTYRNSVTSFETPLANSIAVRGADYGHFVDLKKIRREAGFENNPSIDDPTIASYRDQAEDEVLGFVALAYLLPLPSIPFILEYCAMKLAAGFLLVKEYGAYQEGENKQGLGKISEARAVLKRIANRELSLIGMNEYIIPEDPSTISSWPDDSCGRPMFETHHRY